MKSNDAQFQCQQALELSTRRRSFFMYRPQQVAKESGRATETSLNELLQRFVVRQAKRRVGQWPDGASRLAAKSSGHGGRFIWFDVEIGSDAAVPFFS
jgi:hypothetical protein